MGRPPDRCATARLLRLLCVVWSATVFSRPAASVAVQPIRHWHDLVAGEGLAGHRDGAFQTARFNHPVGLAQSEDGSRLYVADQDNHRIRTIDLDRFNRVDTLCGTGAVGRHDDACAQATFNAPGPLVALPGQRLLVADGGNQVFRLIDLRQRTTSTIVAIEGDGQPRPLSASGVWGVVYDRAQDAFYFSQPAAGKVRRYAFATRRVNDIEWGAGGPAHPSALALWEHQLVIGDRAAPEIYHTALPPGIDPTARLSLERWPAHGPTLAFATSPISLVALRPTAPQWVRVSPAMSGDLVPIQLASTEGPLLSTQAQQFGELLPINPAVSPGLIEDRRSPRRYYFASESLHSVLGLTDVGMMNPQGGRQFETEYAPPKPPGTSRILLLGDSRTYQMALPFKDTLVMNLASQLEVTLNTHSALEERGQSFQVIFHGEDSWHSVPLWPYHVTPKLAATFDIDLVALVVFPMLTVNDFFSRQFMADGVPGPDFDPEYLLTDAETRFPVGPYRNLLELCRRKGCVQSNPEGIESIVDPERFMADPETREALLAVISTPMQLLGKKLADLNRHRATPVRMAVYFTPLVAPNVWPSTDLHRGLWQRILAGTGIEFVDLTGPVHALALTYFPTSHPGDYYHMTPAGYRLLSEVLAHTILTDRRRQPSVGRPREPSSK